MVRLASRLAVAIVVGSFVVVGGVSPASAGGGCHQGMEAARTEVRADTVSLFRACFAPPLLRVEPGTTVTFRNDDSFDHIVIGTGWGSGKTLGQGDEFTQTFRVAGTYAYTCNLHYGMNGAVIVGEGAADKVSLESAQPVASVDDDDADDDDGMFDDSEGVLLVGSLLSVVVAFAAGRVTARRRSAPTP